MGIWTLLIIAGAVIVIVLFVVWGPDVTSRRNGDGGPDRPQGPLGSGDSGGGGGDGGGV